MTSVESTLRNRAAQKQGSLIGYFPAGYPSVEQSVEALVAMANNGCNILEIGVPYSDPVMDGPVIQRATETALSAGFKLKNLFEVIEKVREQTDVPILVMSYWNPIIRYGLEQFANRLKESGAQGIITPDLIPDEAEDWIEISERLSLERVFLAAPSSSGARVERVVGSSKGFVYAVSTMGITGERAKLDQLARSVVSRVRSSGSIPTCVGVGVSTADQVREVNTYADGAIVGTAFIKAYEDGGQEALIRKVTELAKGLG
jgi:tryptophan synthase alpha chain